jgi:hypothetical protein
MSTCCDSHEQVHAGFRMHCSKLLHYVVAEGPGGACYKNSFQMGARYYGLVLLGSHQQGEDGERAGGKMGKEE